MRSAALVVGATALLGCGSTELPAAGLPLVGLGDFVLTSAEEDPWADHRPAEVQCSGLTGWYIEDDVIEVDTARCNYLSASAPTRRGAARGDRLRGEVSHFDLTSVEPAQAHLALMLGERVLWERTVAVPGPADVLVVEAEVPEAVAQGTPLLWHLHNHGQNHWRLSEVRLIPR